MNDIDIDYDLNNISAPNCNEQEKYVNDLLKNNNMEVLPFITNITDEISNKADELFKSNYDNIKYFKKPKYEHWMYVYKNIDKTKKFSKLRKYHELIKDHNYEFCKILLQDNYKFIEHINDNIKDQDLCNIAFNGIYLNDDFSYLKYIPESFQTINMQEKIVKKNGIYLEYIKSSPFTICKLAIENNPNAIEHIDINWKHYNDLCEIAVKININALQYIKKEWKNYVFFCEQIITKNEIALKYVNKDCKCYREICINAIKRNISAIKYINKECKNYDELCHIAFTLDINVLQFIDNDCKKYTQYYKIFIVKKLNEINIINNISQFKGMFVSTVDINDNSIEITFV